MNGRAAAIGKSAVSDRALRRLHAAMLAIEVPLFAAVFTLSVINGSFGEEGTFIALAIAMIVSYTAVGSLVVRRQPRNLIGWLLLAIGAGFLLIGFADEYAQQAFESPGSQLPAPELVAWFGNWTFIFVVGPVPLLLSLFPTGRVPTPRWRLLPWFSVASASILTLFTILRPGPLDSTYATIRNPTGVQGLGTVTDAGVWIGGLGLLVAAIMSVAALIVRARRGPTEERQQVRWLAYAAAVAISILVFILVTSSGDEGEVSAVGNIVFFAFFIVLAFGFPSAIAIAILRYRLYDLDVVVKKTLVFGIVVVLLVAALAFIALVAGALVGRTGVAESPEASFVYAFVLGALAFPIWRVARRLADRIVYGGRASPYTVLSDFSERMSEAFSTDDVLPRMARVVAEAVGAEHVQIWLRVGTAVRPAGGWPDRVEQDPVALHGADLPDLGPGDAFEVRHQGELLGAVVLTMPANDPMNPSKARLVRDLAAQAGLVLRNVRLIEELRASRQRLVSAQDQERRRLERNIHDGAQQQLVALAVKLRLADSLVERDPAASRRLLDELQEETNQALQDLRDLARGIYPPLLADEGLGAALAAQAKKSPIPVTVDADGVGRHPQDVEAAVYFTCLEALGNVAKHAVGATRAEIRLGRDDGVLRFSVADDGSGFDPATSSGGSGLQGIADRLEAIGGSVEVDSAPGAGTVLRGSVPVGADR